MKVVTRSSAPTDDLAALWPHLAATGLNDDQVLVAVNENDELLGGVALWDGGHGMVYVGELTVLSPTGRRRIAKRLAEALLDWGVRAGKAGLLFHTVDPLWTSYMLRVGATITSTAHLMTLALPRPIHGGTGIEEAAAIAALAAAAEGTAAAAAAAAPEIAAGVGVTAAAAAPELAAVGSGLGAEALGAGAGLGAEAGLGAGASSLAPITLDATTFGGAAGAGGGGAVGGFAPLTFEATTPGVVSTSALSAGDTVAPMAFDAAGELAGANLATDSVAPMAFAPEMGSGAEAIQGGGQLATGIMPGEWGWQSALPTMAQAKSALQAATLASALGQTGKAILTPPPPPAGHAVPLPPVTRSGRGAPPVSDQLIQELIKRMGQHRAPVPLRF